MIEKDFKNTVLDNARDIFIRFGYKKTTVNDIAKACNKSKGLVYHHFKNKEEIFRIVAINEIDNLFAAIDNSICEQKDVKDKLKAFLLIWFNFLNNDETLSHKIIIEFFDYMHVIEDVIISMHQRLFDIVKNILSAGVSDNIFKYCDPEQTASIILQMLNDFSYGLIRKILNLKKASNSDIDKLIDVIFYGLVKR